MTPPWNSRLLDDAANPAPILDHAAVYADELVHLTAQNADEIHYRSIPVAGPELVSKFATDFPDAYIQGTSPHSSCQIIYYSTILAYSQVGQNPLNKS